jgi:polyisoprenoid-binding protein YceI
MQDPAFFDAAKYPEMKFISTKFVASSPRKGLLYGDLTMKGITKEVILEVDYHNVAMHDRYKINVARFSASGTLDRRDFGLTVLPLSMIGAIVDIRIEISAFEGNYVPYYMSEDGSLKNQSN